MGRKSAFDSMATVEGARFPSTLWTMMRAAADPASPASVEAWNDLVRRYWKPVYAYVRRYWRKTQEESRDLAQSFFLWLFERGDLRSLAPGASTFRGYLKTALKHFLTDHYRAQAALKRGGGASLVSLDDVRPDLVPDSNGRDATPDQEFDGQWMRDLLEEGVRELKKQLLAERKETYYDVFYTYCVAPRSASMTSSGDPPRMDSQPTYGEVAAKWGLSESDVRNYLSFCRSRLRSLLKLRIKEYAAGEDETRAEMAELFGS